MNLNIFFNIVKLIEIVCIHNHHIPTIWNTFQSHIYYVSDSCIMCPAVQPRKYSGHQFSYITYLSPFVVIGHICLPNFPFIFGQFKSTTLHYIIVTTVTLIFNIFFSRHRSPYSKNASRNFCMIWCWKWKHTFSRRAIRYVEKVKWHVKCLSLPMVYSKCSVKRVKC